MCFKWSQSWLCNTSGQQCSYYNAVDGLYEDNGTLFITSSVENRSQDGSIGLYDIASGTITRKTLQFPGPIGGPADTLVLSRNTEIAFDGTWFYYAVGTSSPTANPRCRGRLARIGKDAVLSGVGKTVIVAENLEPLTRVRFLDGKIYVGTAANEFFRPEAYGGQVFRYNP